MSTWSRLRGLAVVAALVCALPACGGDDDDDVNVPDGGGSGSDAGGGGADSGGASVPADNLGAPCSETEPCPRGGMGETCLVGPDGVGFCSIECGTLAVVDVCGDGYTGPGAPLCAFTILDEQGNPTDTNMCGVVCQAPPEANCAPNVCNGTCPGDLACTATQTPELSVCDLGDGGGGADAGVAAPLAVKHRTIRAVRGKLR